MTSREIFEGRKSCDLQVMVTKGMLPFEFDKSRPTRFGLLPKNATSPEELRWFEAPPAVMFHTAAAWQEGHVIKLYTCVFGDEVSGRTYVLPCRGAT